MWLYDLPEHSLLFVVINEWAPALITIFVGGAFASIPVPRLQGMYATKRALADKRLDLVDRISVRFRHYLISRPQLI